jgi:hypothetical protein
VIKARGQGCTGATAAGGNALPAGGRQQARQPGSQALMCDECSKWGGMWL